MVLQINVFAIGEKASVSESLVESDNSFEEREISYEEYLESKAKAEGISIDEGIIQLQK